MKVIFIKNVFLPFLANTDPPSYKSNPFYFSKIILFFLIYFSIRKAWFKVHFGHIIAIMQKSRTFFDIKNWLKRGLANLLMIILVFGSNFLPETFLISWIFQVYRIEWLKNIKVIRKKKSETRTPEVIEAQIY